MVDRQRGCSKVAGGSASDRFWGLPLRRREACASSVQAMNSRDRDLASENAALRAQHRAVADLGLLALRGPSLKRLLDRAADMVRDALQTDFSKVLALTPVDRLRVQAGAGWPEGVVGEVEVPADGESQASFALRSHAPVIVEDLTTETRFPPAQVFLDLGVRSGVNVIIEGVPRPYGVLEVDSRQPRAYTADEIAFLQLVANILSSAIERQARDEERERFASLAAHELRTPLTSILGFSLRMLKRGVPGEVIDEGMAEELRTLHHEARRLQLTVTQLSQLAQVGHLPTEMEPVNLTRLLHQVVLDTAERYPLVKFTETQPDDEMILEADESLLEGALVNLLDNGAKYSAPGSEVQVVLERRGDQAIVRIRDACGGLGETSINELFEPYYRGSTRHKAPGLGIGLYLVQEVATALGGDISVKDIPGDGCVFALTLPITILEPAEVSE